MSNLNTKEHQNPPGSVSTVNVSVGTAAVLGLAQVKVAIAPTTAYLMLGGRCAMNCGFCAQARESQASALYLSRVTWPEFELEAVVDRLAAAATRGEIRRICLQVTVTADAFDQSLCILKRVKAATDSPVDVAILPRDLEQVERLIKAGADHIGFGLDAACERVFCSSKGGSWPRSLAMIEETARTFPGQAAVHLIVGLGETEQEMVERIQWVHDLGSVMGLFAFTPVHGTSLAHCPPPPLEVYRRMQAARWLIVQERARVEGMKFDSTGRLIDLGAPPPVDGEPFRTSGCPDCNRPFYNEHPSGPMYNYARPLTPEESRLAIEEMRIQRPC